MSATVKSVQFTSSRKHDQPRMSEGFLDKQVIHMRKFHNGYRKTILQACHMLQILSVLMMETITLKLFFQPRLLESGTDFSISLEVKKARYEQA